MPGLCVCVLAGAHMFMDKAWINQQESSVGEN